MKKLVWLAFALIMTFQPLSADSIDGKLYLTFNLNGHLYEKVFIDDANEMLVNTVADGIESVLTDQVIKKYDMQLAEKKSR